MSKTAMEEAIDYLKSFGLTASANILEDKFIEKEKQQIIEAHKDGEMVMGESLRAKEYFKNKYNK